MLWVGFLLLVFACLAIDLGAFRRRHKHGEDMTLREATVWTLIWISVGVAFSGVIYYIYQHGIGGAVLDTRAGIVRGDGGHAATLYLTAFVLEKSLSIDNLFVIALVFQQFGVRPVHQHRVLLWGILGAIIMRGIMIGGGLYLVERFSWLFYVFGLYLAYQGVKLVVAGDDDDEGGDEESWFHRAIRKVLPISEEIEEDHFVTRINGKFFFTPLVLALIVVEFTDVMFALDSIPAVLAVSTEDFICYTSNIFAVLGLRSLYFVLAEMMERFKYLKHSLAVILVFVGVKLIFHHQITEHIPQAISIYGSLAIITLTLVVGILWSWKKGGEVELERSEAERGGPEG